MITIGRLRECEHPLFRSLAKLQEVCWKCVTVCRLPLPSSQHWTMVHLGCQSLILRVIEVGWHSCYCKGSVWFRVSIIRIEIWLLMQCGYKEPKAKSNSGLYFAAALLQRPTPSMLEILSPTMLEKLSFRE